MNNNTYLPKKTYKMVQEAVCIVCVDIVVKTSKGVLLGVRAYDPEMGKRWLIGGRILFGEKLESAAIRKVRQETGLKVKLERLIGAYSLVYTHVNDKRHNLAIAFLARQVGGKLKKTSEYSKYEFIKKSDHTLAPYVRKVLADSRVFMKGGAKAKVMKIPVFTD